ncbi:thiamine pyrophosphate-dependent enzyme [Candidatus Dormiibacter inghamiae]
MDLPLKNIQGCSPELPAPLALPPEALSILRLDGTLTPGWDPPLTERETLSALHLMMLSRALDHWAIRLQRMGRLGTYGPVNGQEASVVGSSWALEPALDWLAPAYREQPAMLHPGLSLDKLLAGYMGKLAAARIPDDVLMLPRNQSVCAQLPHAVGLAWAQRLRRTGAAVMAFIGEGASSEGDFHESCNLAGVVGAPIVLVVQNNGGAISTPSSRQTAGVLWARATGYGFPGCLVDGNDLFAVYATARDAVRRARGGEGPTLIESRTYRMGFHNTTDNPAAYRNSADVAAAATADPILRVQRYLTKLGKWHPDVQRKWSEELDREIRTAIEQARTYPAPRPEEVFEHVYADPPGRVRDQRQALLDSVERGQS